MPARAGAASPMPCGDWPPRRKFLREDVSVGARVSTYDDGTEEVEFFEEPETLEAPDRPRRSMRPSRPGGPRRPSAPPPSAVALARLAGFVALAIAVVVGLVFWVGSCQGKTKHDEYSSYMDDVRPIAQSSAAAGSEFADALRTSKTSAALQSKLTELSHQQQEEYDSALRLRPPGPLQAANQEVLGTLQLRALAFAGLANTVAESGSKDTATVSNRLAQQAQQLTASDLVWANLFRLPATQTMARLGVKGVIAPPSVIVPNSEVISPNAFTEVFGRVKSTSTPSGKVTGLHGSELLSTEAAAGGSTRELSPSTATTVVVAADLQFKVTFKNAGDFEEFNVPVTLTVNVFGKAKPVVNKTQKVASIQKGATATVSFGNLNLPTAAFGNNATVRVEVGKVPGETNIANNKAQYQVFFSLGSGG